MKTFNFKQKLARLLDIPYPIFRKHVSFELYRYLAVGGICFLLNMGVFHFSYYYFFINNLNQNIFFNNNLMSLLTSMVITVPIGFYLTKNFVFSSKLKENTQLFRYSVSILLSLFLSKNILDIFIINLCLNVTVSFLVSIFVTQIFLFYFQKLISFR
ncbi:GtrA family protein [Pedobacter frigoris]|uniref:GtrA/DPMS transmembrane domain-containing protein n=1 Tax=Pedobacter frigoris TaxID=2571272 RepID=A0A4U1CLJ9_9SPHI|nr:hypothetical protein FA047_07950 [Pedobacter frigoris]